MQARASTDSTWSGKLTPEEKKLSAVLLARMEDEDPLCSQEIQSQRKAKSHAWNSTTVAKSTLQKIFTHGRVLIARREANRRYYDLAENVLPASILNASTPTPAETTHWLALLKLRQRRLALLIAAELKAVIDEVIPITVTDASVPRLRILKSDVEMLDHAATATKSSSEPLLIAPLDPLIYDRRLAEGIWNFDFRWEVCVPPHKRVRGYYALPLLHGHRFIGQADVKADRSAGLRQVVAQKSSSAVHANKALKSLANFLGMKASF